MTGAVDVADDGMGIPGEYRERVLGTFERGFDPDSLGTALGLPMCRRIVEDVGGEISIVDTEPGRCFRMRLPASWTVESRLPAATPSQR